MDIISRNLIERLTAKGMEITSIPAFIRNVAYSISMDRSTKPSELNRKMVLLGWGDVEIDPYTLDLIVALFDAKKSGPLNHREINIF